MSILRTDKIAGLDSVSAITGSVEFKSHPSGNGTYLSYVDSDRIFNFGDGNFTIEFWMKPNVVDTSVLFQDGDNATIMDYGYGNTSNSANAWFAVHHEDQGIKFAFQNSDQLTSSNFLTANTWHHVSINHVRTGSSGKTTIYGDGTAVGSMSSTQSFTDALTRELTIGNQNNVNRAFDGKLSNVRVCKGHAVYTAAYTPPTRELVVHFTSPGDETILLCCQSSQDAGMDATGKILTLHANDLNSSPPKPSTDVPDVGNDHTHGTVLEGGTAFSSLNYMTLPRGTTTQSNRGRGLIMGGFYPEILTMEHVSLISSANSIKFGDLGSSSIAWGGAGASSTRAVIGGGAIPAVINNIEYVTIATLGDAINFGDLDVAKRHAGTVSNETKALWGGGETASSNTMTAQVDSVTIATTGDAADFGDLTVARRGSAPASSATRGVWSAGQINASDFNNVIDYVTIATTGNATDFGDTIATRGNHAGCSNNIRGIIGTGTAPAPGAVPNTIDYITIASTGNSTDFGDLYLATYSGGAMASQTRGLFVGGANHPGGVYQNILQYVNISTTGNAMDFGDMATLRGSYDGNTSDCHGGLGQ